MNQPFSVVYRYTLLACTPAAFKPEEAPLAIVCESVGANHHCMLRLNVPIGIVCTEADTLPISGKVLCAERAVAEAAV